MSNSAKQSPKDHNPDSTPRENILDTGAEHRIFSTPEDFEETLRVAGKSKDGPRGVRAFLHSMYKNLLDNKGDLKLAEADGFAEIFDKYGWSTHARKIREFGVGDVPDPREPHERLARIREFELDKPREFYELGELLGERLQNRKVNSLGFNLAAELLLYDLQQGKDGFSGEPIRSSLAGQPSMFYGILRMYIPELAKMAYPADFAHKVEGVREAVTQAVAEDFRAAREENPPAPIEMDLGEYLAHVSVVAGIIHDASKRCGGGLILEKMAEPNPYYGQIEPNGGIALEMYYGGPSNLLTPLGKISIARGGCTPEGIMDVLHEELGLVEIIPLRRTVEGEFGPIYAITRSPLDQEIPLAQLRQRQSYVEYDEAKRLWDAHRPRECDDSGALGRRFAADDKITTERSALEPEISEADIHSLKSLHAEAAMGAAPYIKYTEDGGKLWHWGVVRSLDLECLRVDNEVMPNTQVHSAFTFTDENFAKGLVVRLATADEVKDMKFSYDR